MFTACRKNEKKGRHASRDASFLSFRSTARLSIETACHERDENRADDLREQYISMSKNNRQGGKASERGTRESQGREEEDSELRESQKGDKRKVER